jgi:RHS repeat-associated protein
MMMPGRSYDSEKTYRYGFNGMEQDVEPKGKGNSYTTEFRQYDPRLGRWLTLDPKARSFVDLSPYSAMGSNPIYITDIRGDSIPTKFYDKHGQETNEIPDVLQKQFQQEYGITLGYANGKLYKAGDHKTEATISKDAKADWEKALGTENTEQKLIFGFELATGLLPTRKGELTSPVVMGEYGPLTKVAYIDLADFDANGEILGVGVASSNAKGNSTILSPERRIDNLARIIEHEFLCHGVKNLLDEGYDGLGAVENQINIYRKQMGVPLRDSYQFASERWTPPNIRTMEEPKQYVSRTATGKNGEKYTMEYERKRLSKMKRYVHEF